MRDNDGEERRSELLQKIADHLYVTLDCNRKESRYPLWSNSENDSADNCNVIIIVVELSLVTYLLTYYTTPHEQLSIPTRWQQ